jgi:hypothetical protein
MKKHTKGTGVFVVWDEAQLEQHKPWKERSVGWIAPYAGQMLMLSWCCIVLTGDAKKE